MRTLIEYNDFAVHFEPDVERPDWYRAWLLPMTATSRPTLFDAGPFDSRQFQALAWTLAGEAAGQQRDTRRRSASGERGDLKGLGSRIFDALFHEGLRDAFDAARHEAEDAGRGLRLRLVVDPDLGEPALRLLSLPWELLFDRHREERLSQNPRMALVRHLRNATHPPPRLDLLKDALRILTIAPTPQGYEHLDLPTEADRLGEVLARRGRLALRSVEPPTLPALRRALRDFDPHVIHFYGHGAFAGGGTLCFEREDGSADEVAPEALAEALAGALSLRLAVLNACDSGRVPSVAAVARPALALLHRLTAVVAMQTRITDRAAIAFAGSFYDAIAAGDPLEAAMAEGRQAIRNEVGNSEGAIPALYLRRDDGQLFRRIDRSDLAQWLHPQDDLVQVLTQRFIGRSFVFDKIAEFLANDTKRGYFLLRGDPGIGKSALLAEWIRREKAVYHFNVRNDNDCNRSSHFLGNVCAQLILRYQLPYPTLPGDATSGPWILEQLLREISEKRLKTGEKLLIAVDALDEVVEEGNLRGGNLLDLPPWLPENVFFVLTMRRPPQNERAPRLSFKVTMEQFDLEHDSSENRADISTYVEMAEERDPETLESWWRARGLDREQFLQLLADRSEGNFSYLSYVVPEIAKGRYRDEGVDSLPQGLLRYYEDHWQRLRELCGEDWRTYQLPVLGALTVVGRPLEFEIVHYLTSIKSAVEVLAVLLSWEPFLHVRRHSSGKIHLQTYRFYHGTFIEFIENQPEVDLVASERRMRERVLAGFEELSASATSSAEDADGAERKLCAAKAEDGDR